MDTHRANRDYLLHSIGAMPSQGRQRSGAISISPDDYVAVPQPVNLRVRPVGDCLVWRYGLNADGYGIGSFPSGETLAHRQSFNQSRPRLAASSILHFCHRPYCIQPSHLYEGSAQDNADDRKIRVSEGLEWGLSVQKAEQAHKQAKYRWESPVDGHPPLLTVEADHQCQYIISAMERLICPTCGSSGADGEQLPESELQPKSRDRNSADVIGRSRSFRDLGNGITVQSDVRTTISIPQTRAERRRRAKVARKDPMRDQVRLLGSQRVNLAEGGEISISTDGVTGPGFVVLVAHPVRHGASVDAKGSES